MSPPPLPPPPAPRPPARPPAMLPVLFWGALALRCLNALLLRTAFAPDEYWQSVEVAHRMVFGCAGRLARAPPCVPSPPHPLPHPPVPSYGHLTWEWAAGLRSYAHPAPFAALYLALRQLGLDSGWAVRRGPMLLQAVCAAATDVYAYRAALMLFGAEAARCEQQTCVWQR